LVPFADVRTARASGPDSSLISLNLLAVRERTSSQEPDHPSALPDEGRLQPVGMVDEVGGQPPLDAEPPPGDGVSWGRGGSDDPAVLDVEEEAATAAAVDADGGDLLQNGSLLEIFDIGGTRSWRYYPFGWRIEELEAGTAKKKINRQMIKTPSA